MQVPLIQIKNKSTILSDTRWLAGSLYLSKVISLPCSIFMARFLGPSLYGTWNALRLILRYAAFLQLGMFDGMTREIPYCKGRNNYDLIGLYRSNVFSISLLISIFVAIILALYAFVFGSFNDPIIQIGIGVMAFILVFYHLYGFYEYLLKAEQDFKTLSKVKIFYTAGGPFLQVISVLLWGIYGLFFATLSINIGIFLYIYVLKPISLKWPSLKYLIPLSRTGLPMMLNGMADILLYTSDRIMILAFLGTTELGYYAAATLAASFVDFIPTALQNVLLPKIMHQRGINEEHANLGKYWLEPIYILSYLLPVFVGVGWLISPIILNIFLPKYIPGLLALKILVFGMCFSSILALSKNLFVALNKQFRVLLAFIGASVVSIVLNYSLLKIGLGITGVAIASSSSFFILSIVMLYMSLLLQETKFVVLDTLIRIYKPIIAALAFLIIIERILPVQINYISELYYLSVRLILFIGLQFIFSIFSIKKDLKLFDLFMKLKSQIS
jgi:O-antigen/teichoic acid export membrane protein